MKAHGFSRGSRVPQQTQPQRGDTITRPAAEELKTIIENKTGPVASRVSAIRTALDYAYRAVELEDIEHRLVDVEEAIKNHGGQAWGGSGLGRNGLRLAAARPNGPA